MVWASSVFNWYAQNNSQPALGWADLRPSNEESHSRTNGMAGADWPSDKQNAVESISDLINLNLNTAWA